MSNTTAPYTNTPKAIDENDNSVFPSAFSIDEMVITNSEGEQFDLSSICTNFTIVEEIFSPILVLNLRIRDTINFFEDFSLSGQEKITLRLSRKVDSKKESISLKFSVKEYPNYEKRASEPNVAEYSIIAVSNFAYDSMLLKISKSVKGNPIDNIVKIFKDSLNVQCNVRSICSTVFDGIITICSPLKAIEWLRTKAYDTAGSPFFVYSTLNSNDVIQISSMSDIWSNRNTSIGTFEYRQLVVNSPKNTKEWYNENATRVLDMKSNIRIDKLDQAIRGAFASSTISTDVSTKQNTISNFDISKDKISSLNTVGSLFSGSLLSKLFGAKPINEVSDASRSYLSTNVNAISNGNLNSTSSVSSNLAKAKSYYANFESVNHQIALYGDFTLNVGKKLTLRIPKSITSRELNDELDKAMSGDYIIAVASHSFKDGMYTSKLKIIKDKI